MRLVSLAANSTFFSTPIPSMVASIVAWTGLSLALQASAEMARCALSNDGMSTFVMTCGWRKATALGRFYGDIAPQSHVFVGRGGVPINPGDSEIIRFRRENLHGEDVRSVGQNRAGDVELVCSISAGDLFVPRNEFAINPNIGAVVNTLEIQPQCWPPSGALTVNSLRYHHEFLNGLLPDIA